MFRNLFRPDSPLMIVMTQITDCIFLSLFWLLGCFPVVTAGASFAALYDATFRTFRQGERHSWQRFFHSFRQNLKAGILPGLFVLGVFGGAAWLLIQLWNNAAVGALSWTVFSGAAFFGVMMLGVLSVVLPMLSRFENGFLTLVKNSVFLALANMPRTLVLGFLNAAVIFLCVRFVFPLFFLPSLAALIGSLLIEPMFRPYMNNEEDAAQ